MIKKINKKITSLILLTVFLTGCVPFFSKNRFVRNSVINSFSFGLAGYNDSSFCIKNVPNFAKYLNGVRPTKTCMKYRYYTCHINHYCNGDKQCEKDAKDYWLGANWISSKTGKIVDSYEWHKTYCDRIEQQCNSAKPNDQTCRR